MNRRSFLLIAGGAALLSPRIESLHPFLLQRQTRSDGIGSALCRGGPIRAASAATMPAPRIELPGARLPEGFMPGYGPPRDYQIPNADFAVGGNPALSALSPRPVETA